MLRPGVTQDIQARTRTRTGYRHRRTDQALIADWCRDAEHRCDLVDDSFRYCEWAVATAVLGFYELEAAREWAHDRIDELLDDDPTRCWREALDDLPRAQYGPWPQAETLNRGGER